MSLQRRIQEQLEDIERRYNELLDEIQDRLPDRAAELMDRARELNADIRRQLTDAGRRLIGQDADLDDEVGDEPDDEIGDGPDDEIVEASEPGARPDLEQLSRAELYERAKALDIDGRSRMSKAQLVAALRRAG